MPAAAVAAAATVCALAVGAGPDIAVEDSSEIHALATTLPADVVGEILVFSSCSCQLTNHPDATMLDDDDAGTSDRPPRRPAMDVIGEMSAFFSCSFRLANHPDATMLDYNDDEGATDRPPRRRAMDVIGEILAFSTCSC